MCGCARLCVAMIRIRHWLHHPIVIENTSAFCMHCIASKGSETRNFNKERQGAAADGPLRARPFGDQRGPRRLPPSNHRWLQRAGMFRCNKNIRVHHALRNLSYFLYSGIYEACIFFASVTEDQVSRLTSWWTSTLKTEGTRVYCLQQ